ncbi:hypothetical protein [Citricoccus sp. NR2]|uniref:hypothetical protein n=1 Tax=Citricoccus sp. NR2 TaxID=3004095 RepID=UPI0022DE82D8|nr:hypothetical protein [Citricoccus sp. NR2]WBL19810.1 hypothetical protein O1A05_03700 [Citricoccus sp. NR2]
MNPLERSADPSEVRSHWSRFDTPGRTIYLADSKQIAYAETLSLARASSDFRSAVDFVARHFGMSWQDAWDEVRNDWSRNGHMTPGSVPAGWRDDHLVYQLKISSPAPWVDLTAMESLAAVSAALGPNLRSTYGVDLLTLSTLTGENREVTSVIAEWIRTQIVDDGSYPAGVKFHSKLGGGACWAFWMRRTDDGLGNDPVEVTEEHKILKTDVDMKYVLGLYGARCH